MMEAKEYMAHVDSKKRVSIRGARYKYYAVKEYENGCVILEPRELTPVEISKRTLSDMDNAVKNFKAGEVSDAIDLSEF